MTLTIKQIVRFDYIKTVTRNSYTIWWENYAALWTIKDTFKGHNSSEHDQFLIKGQSKTIPK